MIHRPANCAQEPHYVKDALTSRYAIAISHVNKVYSNGTVALQDMNLSIDEGDIYKSGWSIWMWQEYSIAVNCGLGKKDYRFMTKEL